MEEVKAIGVYCSSYEEVAEVYKKAAAELGQQLAHRKITLVYGGGALGLMGELSNAAITHGGDVIGYMPQHLKEFEKPNTAITDLQVVETMHARKRLMFERSDAFFILPGGFGTLDETFELIAARQIRLHEKPIIFININEYWNSLQDLIANIFNQHFAKPTHKDYFKFVDSIPKAFQALLKAPEPITHEPGEKGV